MGLVAPDYGTIFWMIVVFALVFFILKKFGWGPILRMLKKREESINKALQSAELAREEVSQLKVGHDQMMQEARMEREKLMAEARVIKEQMIEKAREEAARETEKLLGLSHRQIESEKLAAISEIRQQVAVLSVDIAEKILRKQLKDRREQEGLIREQLRDLKLN
ncbi:MAG: F0F1 ATP synthase subunit B [Bacteroidota bacterium]